MNLGIFISSFKYENMLDVCKLLQNKNFKDRSLFISEIGIEPDDLDCPIFSPTELPFFTGRLLITHSDGAVFYNNININCDAYYIYEKNVNLFKIMDAVKNIKVLVLNNEDLQEVKRKFNKDAILISKIEDFANVE